MGTATKSLKADKILFKQQQLSQLKSVAGYQTCVHCLQHNACNSAAIAGLVLALGTETIFLLVQSYLNTYPKYYPMVKSDHRVLLAYISNSYTD